MTYYEYIEKAKCTCGYVWTTSSSDNVRCACNDLELDGATVVSGTPLTTDEDEFKSAVATELQIDISELTLIKI